MRRILITAAGLVLAASAAVAQPAQPPIREFDLRTTEHLGRTIAGQDTAAWLASDAPMPKANTVPVGGHVRFTISADGRTVERKDMLSTSCLVLDPMAQLPPGATPVGVTANHILSPTPVETHVSVQLQAKIPLYVQAGGKLWEVQGGRITEQKTP